MNFPHPNLRLCRAALVAVILLLGVYLITDGLDRSRREPPATAAPAPAPVAVPEIPSTASVSRPPATQPQSAPSLASTPTSAAPIPARPATVRSNAATPTTAAGAASPAATQLPAGVPLTPPVVIPPETRLPSTLPTSGTNRDYSPP